MGGFIRLAGAGKVPGDIFPWPGLTPPKGSMPLNGDWFAESQYPKLYAVCGHRYGAPLGPGYFHIPDGASYPNAATPLDATARETITSAEASFTPIAGGCSVIATVNFGALSENEYGSLVGHGPTTAPTGVMILPKMKKAFVPVVLWVEPAGGIGMCEIRIGLTGRNTSTEAYLDDGFGGLTMRHCIASVWVGQSTTGGGVSNWTIQQRDGDGGTGFNDPVTIATQSGEPGVIVPYAMLIDFDAGTVRMMGPGGVIAPETIDLETAGLGAGLFPVVNIINQDSGIEQTIQIDLPKNGEIYRGLTNPFTSEPIPTGFPGLLEAGYVNVWDCAFVGDAESVLWCIKYK